MENFKKESTYELIYASQSGNASARSRLVEENMGLILSVAKKFYNRGYDKDDINQLAAMGLIRAIDNFNPSLGVRFSTYAVPVIMGEIKRFLRDDGPLKVSRTLKQTAIQIGHFVESVQKTSGKQPGVEEIAQHLGISSVDVVEALESTAAPESIYASANDSDICLRDILKTDSNEGAIITNIDIKNALSDLPERERNIIVMRYYMDRTQTDIAKKIGVSQVQISRLEKKILEKLKKTLACEN